MTEYVFKNNSRTQHLPVLVPRSRISTVLLGVSRGGGWAAGRRRELEAVGRCISVFLSPAHEVTDFQESVRVISK